MSVTVSDSLPAGRSASPSRFRPALLLRVVVPLGFVGLWCAATAGHPDGLIPPPAAVGIALWDLAFGGIYDDAFSRMLLPDLIASASRVRFHWPISGWLP